MRRSQTLRTRWVIRTVLAVATGIVVSAGVFAWSGAGAQSSAVALATSDVSERVDYVEQTLTGAHARLPHNYLVALAAMSYVAGHVSATQYGYLTQIAHRPAPVNAEEALQLQAGVCGSARDTMLAILRRLHTKARSVDAYYSTPDAPVNGHSTVEVWYQGAWHWFDPTWATIYVKPGTSQWKVLSLVDVLRLPPARQHAYRIGSDTMLWERAVTAAGHSLGIETGMLFVTLPHLRVETGGRTIYQR